MTKEQKRTQKKDYTIGNIVEIMNKESMGIHISLMKTSKDIQFNTKATHAITVETNMNYSDIKKVIYDLYLKMEEEEVNFYSSSEELYED